MNEMLPKSLARKLRAIRRRLIGFTLLEGLALSAAVLLAAVLVAMIIDRFVGWYSHTARYAFTVTALAAAAAALVSWCVRPLLRKRTIISTARQVDFNVPQLEERWSTVAELAQSKDAPAVRGSESMIRKVTQEAEAAENSVSPAELISPQPMFKAAGWFAGALAVLALLFAVNFTQAKLLWQRFWHPGSQISLTQVTASPANHWVPKGEPLTLQAAVQGRLPAAPPQLFLRTESREGQWAMTPQTGAADKFQYAIDSVTDSFSYRVRAGDGQSPWREITAVDRPKISEVKLRIAPPPYSHLTADEKNALPHAIRVLDGSEIAVSFRSDQPLDRLEIDLGTGTPAKLSVDKEGWYHFQARPTNSFTFVASAFNTYQLESKSKPSCHVTVYEDMAPTVKVLEPSDDIAVLPGEKVKVVFEATDDIGLAKAEVIVATTKADGTTNTFTLSVPLTEGEGETKHTRQTVELDTQALGLKHGDQLSYVVQVTDTKQTSAQGTTEAPGSRNALAAAAQAKEEQASKASSAKSADQSNFKSPQEGQASANDKEAETTAASASPDEDSKGLANSQTGEQGKENISQEKSGSQAASADQPEPSEKNSAQASNQSEGSKQANQNQANASSRPSNGDRPPPNEMAKRTLDVGQSAAAEPRSIKVDQWAGQFDGERREKLEIAIEPILKRLEELLAQAQEKADELKAPAASTAGLQPIHAQPLAVATNNLGESVEAVIELNSRTKGTPYAFIGLQLQNISQAHLTPARRNLDQVTLTEVSATNNLAQVNQASFHIARAREMLADLTKTYQKVKRDQQVADAMQRLNKMYQIFLEDTQELLGNKPGSINSYQRKIAEVDEEYVKKLQELLEEKKKIMAELAKVLAEDPRMLRRYLAMMQQQGTSYRDQLTLLAERQSQMQEHVSAWNNTPEGERATLLPRIQETYQLQQKQLAGDAAKLRENMETWLPLDVQPNQVSSVLEQAEKVLQHIGEGSDTNAQDQVLAALRQLRDTLPAVNEISSTNKARLSSYVANRLVEIEGLITAQSGQARVDQSVREGDFAKAAEVIQHRLTQDTVTLTEKLDATEQQVASMSPEIAEKAALLTKTMETDIVPPQEKSVDHLAAREVVPAAGLLDQVVPAFKSAEKTFDELIQLMIAKLDEAPPPDDPGSAQELESLLGMLEDEMKAAESLGIPCRPINVAIQKDWMKPGSSGSGQGMAQAQAQAAQAQAQQAHAETERMEKEARQSAKKALAQAREDSQALQASAPASGGAEAWNKLVSKLGKDLLQGRDNQPPEQYRAAIENYFKTLADPAAKP